MQSFNLGGGQSGGKTYPLRPHCTPPPHPTPAYPSRPGGGGQRGAILNLRQKELHPSSAAGGRGRGAGPTRGGWHRWGRGAAYSSPFPGYVRAGRHHRLPATPASPPGPRAGRAGVRRAKTRAPDGRRPPTAHAHRGSARRPRAPPPDGRAWRLPVANRLAGPRRFLPLRPPPRA